MDRRFHSSHKSTAFLANTQTLRLLFRFYSLSYSCRAASTPAWVPSYSHENEPSNSLLCSCSKTYAKIQHEPPICKDGCPQNAFD